MDPSGVDREVAGVGFEQRSGELEQPALASWAAATTAWPQRYSDLLAWAPESKGVIDESEADTQDRFDLDAHDLGAELSQVVLMPVPSSLAAVRELDASVAADLDGRSAVVDRARLARDPALPGRDGHAPSPGGPGRARRRQPGRGLVLGSTDGAGAHLGHRSMPRRSTGRRLRAERLVRTLEVAPSDLEGSIPALRAPRSRPCSMAKADCGPP